MCQSTITTVQHFVTKSFPIEFYCLCYYLYPTYIYSLQAWVIGVWFYFTHWFLKCSTRELCDILLCVLIYYSFNKTMDLISPKPDLLVVFTDAIKCKVGREFLAYMSKKIN